MKQKTKVIDSVAAIATLDEYITNHDVSTDPIDFCMIFDEGEEGKLRLHHRKKQPCYGELRPYAKTHPDLIPEDQRTVIKPGDLYNPFPDGTPVMVGIPFMRGGSFTSDEHDTLYEFMFGPESPYRKGLSGGHFTRDTEGHIIGYSNTKADFDPTVFAALLIAYRNVCRYDSNRPKLFAKLQEWMPHRSKSECLLLTLLGSGWLTILPSGTRVQISYPAYWLSPTTSIKKFITGDSNDLTSGGTWGERYAYNRPKVAFVFSDENNPSPKPTLSGDLDSKLKQLDQFFEGAA